MKVSLIPFIQLTVRAFDRHTPDIYSETNIPITVSRNDNPPVVSPPTVTVSIDDDENLGYKVIKLNATDKDGVSLTYSDLIDLAWC